MAQTKAKIIYVGDPMCSWCYGFSPEISKVKDHFEGQLDFQLIMGGLRPYNKETMTDLGDFLQKHWKEVGDRSGQEFNYEILKDESFVYDTEPSARAVVAVRQMDAQKEFEFFKSVQTLFYKENKNTNLVESYLPLVEEMGLDAETFKALFESDKGKEAVRADFVQSGEMGIRGFPTIVLQKGEEFFLIANGYAESEKLITWIEKML